MKIWGGRHSKAPSSEDKQIALGAEPFNVLNHPNFPAPSNTQSALIPGGTEKLYLTMWWATLRTTLDKTVERHFQGRSK